MGLDPRFVLAPSLEQYFVDNATGLPLAAGYIKFYSDINRTVLKSVYEISGQTPNFQYTALPNPLVLSSVGTIVDGSGNNVLPYYFPYQGIPTASNGSQELYYIEVYNSGNVLQFTREGFPNAGAVSPAGTTYATKNLVTNSSFWRNSGTIGPNVPAANIIAPSNHQAFVIPDMQFNKNNTSATDTIMFPQFSQGDTQLTPDVTPQYYFSYSCTVAGSSEATKELIIPLNAKVKTLENLALTLDIYTQCTAGNAILNVYFRQFFGDGGSPSTTVDTLIESITCPAQFTKFTQSFTTPSTTAKSLGTCGDDANYLVLKFPLNLTTTMNVALPRLYLGTSVPSSDFDTYDAIESVTNSPRTGDIRVSMNNFAPFGWVPANDGLIGLTAPVLPNVMGGTLGYTITRYNIDTFFLYSLLWGMNSTYVPIYDHTTGMTTTRGASAVADFAAGQLLAMTKQLGRAVSGTIQTPVSYTFTTNHGVSNSIFTVSSTVGLPVGAPVALTNSGGALPGGLNSGQTYFAVPQTTTTFKLATLASLAFSNSPDVTFSGDGTGTNTVTSPSWLLGNYTGEELGQLPAHAHTLPAHSFVTNQSGGGEYNDGTDGGTAAATASTGVSPIGINLQPTIYYNVFFKL